jgi:hypothetical protein
MEQFLVKLEALEQEPALWAASRKARAAYSGPVMEFHINRDVRRNTYKTQKSKPSSFLKFLLYAKPTVGFNTSCAAFFYKQVFCFITSFLYIAYGYLCRSDI